MKSYEDFKAEWNAKAAALAADGRACRLDVEQNGNVEASTRDIVRWVFWQLTEEQRHGCQANRDSTDDAYWMNIIMGAVEQARGDERKRLVTPLITGLKTLLGEDLFAVVSSEMQWDD